MRCSSLPTFLTCPPSQERCEHPYDPPSPAADSGDAVHELLAIWLDGGDADPDIMARKFGVDRDELEQLFGYGRIAWKGLSQHFPNPRTEERLEGEWTHGTADVFSNDGATMGILDWKSGRVRRNHKAQVVGYAAAAVDAYGMPESGHVTCCVVWLRDFELEVYQVTQDDIDQLDRMVADAYEGPDRYAPGEACTFCKRQLECKAREQYISSAAQSLVVSQERTVTRERLGELWEQSRLLKRALAQYETALKMVLAEGPLAAGGMTLELEERKRDKLSARLAWPILQANGLTDDDIATCLSMSKTAVLSVVSDKAKRGSKAKVKAGLMEQLRSAGAVAENISQVIKATKGKK